MTLAIQLAILGLGTGAIYVILAQGLVVIYRGSGVVNLAHAGYAIIGAFVFNQLTTNSWGTAPAMVVAVLAAAFTGFATDQIVMRALRRSSALARLIATLGVLLSLQSLVILIFGADVVIVAPFLPQDSTHLLGTTVTVDRLYLIAIAVFVSGVLAAVWHRTRVGWVSTAVAENREVAAAQGWSPEVVSSVTWTFGTGLAAIAGILIAPIVELSVLSLSAVMTFALAAALLGGFRSFGATLLGGLGIGVAQAEVAQYIHLSGAANAVPLLIIVVALVARGSTLPPRGHVFDRLPGVGTGRISPAGIVAGLVAIALLTQLVTSTTWLGIFAATFAAAIIFLSLTVLVGYTGQLSLGQYALAGVGALIAARLIDSHGWPFALAAVAGVIGAAFVGLLFALPALRTRGVNLAIVTLSLGVALSAVVFENASYTGGLEGTTVGDIRFLGVNINPTTHLGRYAAFCGVLLVLALVACANLRRGPIGRRLLAMSVNERAAAALGVNVRASKLTAFGFAGALAGLGGIAVGFQASTVTFDQFSSQASTSAVAQAVIGGIGYVLGPVLGALLTPASVPSIIGLTWTGIGKWLPLISGLGLIATLIASHDGLAGQMSSTISRLIGRRSKKELVEYTLAPTEPVKVDGARLTVSDLTILYGFVRAVDSVSFEVKPGEILGVIGPNGAGKTSVMDAITGLTRSTGKVLVDDVSITSLKAHQRARRGVSRSFQALELFDDMTVLENLLVASEAGRSLRLRELLWPKTPVLGPVTAAVVREFELEDCLLLRPDELSQGKRRLVGIARAVAARPSILLLDEPVAGLDEKESTEFARLVRRVAEQWGMAVLVIEHDMSFVMDISDRIVVLDFGRMIAEGTPAEVRENPAAIAAYLGESSDSPEPALASAKGSTKS